MKYVSLPAAVCRKSLSKNDGKDDARKQWSDWLNEEK